MHTGAFGQTSVIYAIVKTSPQICCTVYNVQTVSDCRIPSAAPAPRLLYIPSPVLTLCLSDLLYCLMCVRCSALEPDTRTLLGLNFSFGSFWKQFACSPSAGFSHSGVRFIGDSDAPHLHLAASSILAWGLSDIKTVSGSQVRLQPRSNKVRLILKKKKKAIISHQLIPGFNSGESEPLYPENLFQTSYHSFIQL